MKEKKDKPKPKPLTAAGRKRRAIKAANRLAKIRKAKTKKRDEGIILAFVYLSDGSQSRDDKIKAITFMTEQCGKPKLDKGETVLRKLADCTGLTRQRIHQIIKKAKNEG
ncbi:MAG: hypothetical protein NTV43_16675 [Methylococcales bacterium]|nr:hypothetical protein [Methylococcales bacterium]